MRQLLRASLVLGPLLVSEPLAAQGTASDSLAVVAVVAQFRSALLAGDSTAALRSLANDAVIIEAGSIETRDEYRAHHLPADIAFAQAVPSTVNSLSATLRGDVAWVTSTSVTTGTFQGRAVNSAGAELMVLSRTPQGWQIRAIHWSSRRRNPGQ